MTTNDSRNAKAIISLKLPKKLNLIKLADIIRLRESGNFKKYQTAFHNQLKEFLSGIETGDQSRNFLKKYDESALNLNEMLWSLGQDMMTIGLNTWMFLNVTYPQLSDELKLATTASGVIIKQAISINKLWRNAEPTGHCRRYLASLESL